MQGYRTILLNVLGLTFALAVMMGYDIPMKDQTAITVGLMSILNFALRFFTNTPIGSKPPDPPSWIGVRGKRPDDGFGSPEFLAILATLAASLMIAILVSSCSVISQVKETKPWQPFAECVKIETLTNSKIDNCVVSIKLLAMSADAAEDSGVITNEQEQAFLSRLATALGALRLIRQNTAIFGVEREPAFIEVQKELTTLISDIPTTSR